MRAPVVLRSVRRRTTLAVDGIKAKQEKTWSSGDYGAGAAHIDPNSEDPVRAPDLSAGARVLDVATGTGNSAIAAARCLCQVTAIDYVPELLARGRDRAAAERLPVEFAEGDAEALDFPDA